MSGAARAGAIGPPSSLPALTIARVFIPFAAGYFMSYGLRNVNAVIAPDLAASLGVSAGSLGFLTSAYFLAFAAFQLPLGLLLDRFGPRRVEATLLVCAAAGAFLFAVGETATTLALARALIGVGVSACLMGSFKAFSMWFPAQKQPLVNGCVMTAGGLGALAATAPIEFALEFTDWRGVYTGAGFALLASALLLYTVVPRSGDLRGESGESLMEQIRALGQIFGHREFWRVVPICALSQAAFMSIQGLWAGPWLKDVAGLEREALALHLAAIPPAMIAGFFLVGVAAERLSRRGVSTLVVAEVGLVIFLAAQIALAAGLPLPALAIWCTFGFFGTVSILFYPALTAQFPAQLTGRVLTALNLLTFGSAFVAQWGLGVIIERWPGPDPGSYAPAGYQTAFGVAVMAQTVAFAWLLIRRRKSGH